MRNLKTDTVSRRAIWGMFFRFVVAAPIPLLVTVSLRVVNAASFAFAPIIVAGFTNALINGERVIFWGGMFLLMSGLQILTDVLNHPTQMWLSNRITLHFQQRLLKKAAEIPMLHFLDADFHDLLSRAHRDFGYRVVQWFRSIHNNIHCLATLVGVLGAVFVIGGGLWCAVAMLASAFIVLLTQNPVVSLEKAKERETVRPRRTQETWAELLTSRSSAAEVRLFTAQRWLMEKWEKSYQALCELEIATLQRIVRWQTLAGLSTVFGYTAVIFIAAYASQNANSDEIAGIFTGLIYASGTLQGFLSTIADALGRLAEQSGILRELAALFTIQPSEIEKEKHTAREPEVHTSSLQSTATPIVEMDALSFRYPRADADLLKDITAKIAPGEVVALVGKNGAGKTTLANILLGLYPPSGGNFHINRNDKHKDAASAVFQNFVRFLLPVRDNVGFADIDRIENDREIREVLLRSSSIFSEDLDVSLGPEFGGRDVSGGEWLRLAVARGLFRESQIVVFDEPTAAIDPIAEVEMIRELLRKDESHATLIISHRLGAARLCDRILVLDEGRLIEDGTHETLLANRGIYAEMWHAQAVWYI